MKKIVLLLVLLLLVATGIHLANSYTSAVVTNPVTLSITEQGMLSLAPAGETLMAAQDAGNASAVLVATNNMNVTVACSLECAGPFPVLISDPEFKLAPGDSQEIILKLEGDCPAGKHLFEVTLFGGFDSGRAKVKTAVPVTVTAPVPAGTAENKGACSSGGNGSPQLPEKTGEEAPFQEDEAGGVESSEGAVERDPGANKDPEEPGPENSCEEGSAGDNPGSGAVEWLVKVELPGELDD